MKNFRRQSIKEGELAKGKKLTVWNRENIENGKDCILSFLLIIIIFN